MYLNEATCYGVLAQLYFSITYFSVFATRHALFCDKGKLFRLKPNSELKHQTLN